MIIIYKKHVDTSYDVICFFDIEIELEKFPRIRNSEGG